MTKSLFFWIHHCYYNFSLVFYGSPLPPYGISPAAYYYYYHNGLSHSYHDLSQLQQDNMEQIMKRSGFMPESLQQQNKQAQKSQSQEVIDVSESPVKSPPPRKPSVAGPSWSAKYRAGRAVESPEGNDYPQSTLTVDDAYPLERSVSMPTITGAGTGADEMADSRGGAVEEGNVISDEVIQELGMWEQVIQEEKKDNGSTKPPEDRMESAEDYQIEDVDDRDSVGGSPVAAGRAGGAEEDGQAVQTPSPTLEAASASAPAEDFHLQTQRKQSIVPVVSVQQPTPNLSAGSDSDRRSPVSEEEEVQQKMARRESVAKQVTKQESLASKKGYSQEEETAPAPAEGSGGEEEVTEIGVTGEQQQTPAETVVERQASQEAADASSAAQVNEPPGDKPPSSGPTAKGEKKEKGAVGVSKTGNPGPPARRLSRIPQQLYIKTTPAIPMNANIQHILANVARTEGPFEYPAEAVKAAVIALHDNAW